MVRGLSKVARNKRRSPVDSGRRSIQQQLRLRGSLRSRGSSSILTARRKQRPRVVSYIHVGDASKDDLEEYIKGKGKLSLQVFFEEELPDIDASDVVNGLDQAGTSGDFCDEKHRCSRACPVGCQGHLRPNEIMIYEGQEVDGRLVERKRYKARFVLPSPPAKKGKKRKASGSLVTLEEEPEDIQQEIGSDIPEEYLQIINAIHAGPQNQIAHGWNPEDKSTHLTMKTSAHLTIRRQPVTQSTDGVRGKLGYSRGIQVYEVCWPVRMRGTNAAVGVATRSAPLHVAGYQSLIGNNEYSWGWDIGRKESLHDGNTSNYPPLVRRHYQWSVPETFYMIIDNNQGTLSFCVQNKWLGVACSGLQGTLYPAISTVWGHAEVSLRYVGNSLHQ